MPDFCNRGGPPWQRTDEGWPSRHREFGANQRARARFFRRIVLAAAALVGTAILSTAGAAWLIAARVGLMGWPAAVSATLVMLIATGALALVFRAMRRFASPLGAIMNAADQVAGGDYTARVQASGPPPIRALEHSFNTMTERLQAADRVRRDLMADVAHELRTPLTVLQGRLEGLIDGVYPRDDRQLAQLLDQTHVLSRLIEDLRTLALSDAGALPLHKETVDIVTLVREVVASMTAEAGHKSVSLNMAAPSTVAPLELDAFRIREVLTNLLSNALRHTGAGGRISVSIVQTNDGLSVSVIDDGAGMAAEDAERMFERFYKGPQSRGTGLGLTIAKGIVHAHRGQIAGESRLGQGTTVTFTLPRDRGE